MQDLMTWGAVIAAGGSIIAIIKFWMAMGAAVEEARLARTASTAAAAKTDLALAQLAEYKLEAAREFATLKALAEAERRFAMAVDGMRTDFGRMTDRLDRFIDAVADREK